MTHRLPTFPLFALLWLSGLVPLRAHEVRPGYLELQESAPHRFDVLWKQPVQADRRLRIEPLLPEVCQTVGPKTQATGEGALIQRFTVDCGTNGLEGQRLAIAGLERGLIDVLVRVSFAGGQTLSHLLRPNAPSVIVARRETQGAAVATYLRLGIFHLLLGFDHILFVVGLLFLVPRALELVKVITAFTVAHSLTLALSALELVRLSQAPVEAVIALSILFLAVELARQPTAPVTPPSRGWSRRFPWTLAFGFGLLHGFGFAGALAEIGLPSDAVAPALFLFNLGVEIGQLLIVAALLTVGGLLRTLGVALPVWLVRAPIYVMGSLSGYWLVERVARILS